MWNLFAGDFWGGPFEGRGLALSAPDPVPDPHWTLSDDSLLALATAKALLLGPDPRTFAACFKESYAAHPNAGFGEGFAAWAREKKLTRRASWANGAAMRAAPLGLAARSLPQALDWAAQSAAYTHAHPDGEAGAKILAGALFLLKKGESKASVLRWAEGLQPASWGKPTAAPSDLDCRASRTVPLALLAFQRGGDADAVLRQALSFGGDCDTICAMACALTQTPLSDRWLAPVKAAANRLLTDDEQAVLRAFDQTFGPLV